MDNKDPVKKKSKRGELAGLGMKQNQFKNWDVGTNYKCEKILGSGSYG